MPEPTVNRAVEKDTGGHFARWLANEFRPSPDTKLNPHARVTVQPAGDAPARWALMQDGVVVGHAQQVFLFRGEACFPGISGWLTGSGYGRSWDDPPLHARVQPEAGGFITTICTPTKPWTRGGGVKFDAGVTYSN